MEGLRYVSFLLCFLQSWEIWGSVGMVGVFYLTSLKVAIYKGFYWGTTNKIANERMSKGGGEIFFFLYKHMYKFLLT